MNESKRLKDVWKWKEKVYEKTKNMTRDERIVFLIKGWKILKRKPALNL